MPKCIRKNTSAQTTTPAISETREIMVERFIRTSHSASLSHSWINRFCRLLIRREKKADNYEAMIHFAFAIITWNALSVLG
jgi:hypothetical protein